ncbi:glycine-rich protein DC7.1-like isoform X1 [Vitis riparia]|uniref:glycine-rich protein DC7.1-like isoform X1 n=1 Tax=Vitis riparia TaxID=96939 RepID=UPI00155A3B6E|nr:glycine-rich protein DC7.1-like isoform X1 [Vitis riparia]
MAYSKAFLLLGLLCAVVLVLSSEVSARELAEAAQTQGSVEEAKHWGHGHWHGHWGHGDGHGHGHRHGHHGKPGHGGAAETEENESEAGEN